MCGRYAASRNPEDLVEEFEVERVVPDGAIPASWNVAPTDEVYAVVQRCPPGDSGGECLQRQLRSVRWGLVPSWAKDRSIASKLINARVETVADKPAFRRAFAARRCLLPADGYYEWYAQDDGSKQPVFITRGDGGPLAMAGLYEIWRDPAGGEDAPRLWTTTVITTTATDDLGHIHDRMPMLVEHGAWAQWLDPRIDDPALLRGLLVPAAPSGPEQLWAYPVSTAVNSVRNDGPHLVEPLAEQPAPPAAGLGQVDAVDQPAAALDLRGADNTLF